MRLTLHTDYGIRLLIYLDMHRDRLVTTSEVADAYGISRNHLVKIAQHLTELDYVASVRGRNGGLRLSRDASEVTLGEVVRKLEANSLLIECFDPTTNTCPIAPICGLTGILRDAQEAFFKVLDGYTIRQVSPTPGAFEALGLST